MRIKQAVSIAIFNEDRSKIIGVQRPADDEDLPNAWGLPASSLIENESFEEAVKRTGLDKLGVELLALGCLEKGNIKRAKYQLDMCLYEAKVLNGEISVPQLCDSVTQYQNWQWCEFERFQTAANLGSLCCQLYLTYCNKT